MTTKAREQKIREKCKNSMIKIRDVDQSLRQSDAHQSDAKKHGEIQEYQAQ